MGLLQGVSEKMQTEQSMVISYIDNQSQVVGAGQLISLSSSEGWEDKKTADNQMDNYNKLLIK